MSNSRRLRGSRPQAPRCGVCGGKAPGGKQHVDLPDGRRVCASCRDVGALARRLACGHWAWPGVTVVNTGASIVCAPCAGDTMQALR